MSSVVHRRARIARVRRVEHVQAAGAAAAAQAQLQQLQASSDRILELRLSLTAATGSMAAETLAAQGELAHRLDLARFGMIDAIAAARIAAAARTDERVAARIRQESAERLEERAAIETARLAERRAAANTPPRIPRRLGEGA